MRNSPTLITLLYAICVTLMLSCVPVVGQTGTSSEARSYPPYPDTWDFSVSPSEHPISDVSARKLPNGDVLITYQSCCGQDRYKNITYFEGKRYKSVEEAFGGAFRPPSTVASFKTPRGYTIRSVGTKSGLFQGCYDGLDAYTAVYVDPLLKEIVLNKVIIWRLDKPEQHNSPQQCKESRSFTYWAESIGGQIVPLNDSTFLLVDYPHSVVVRFDEWLRTRSKLRNSRLFVLDHDFFWARFGGRYGDRAAKGIDFKRLHEDLRRWLEEVRGN